MTRAVIEGVTFAICDSFDALTETGNRIEQLLAVGGGAKSNYWVQASATTLGLPVSIPVSGDFGGAFGAARLGMISLGGSLTDIATAPKIERVIDPILPLQDSFLSALKSYRKAYKVIKAIS